MKTIIAGGRDFNDYNYLEDVMNTCPFEITEIVCGKARGADTLGEKWGKSKGIPVKYFMPDWNGLGKKAGHVRNREMGDYADALVAFWDKKSKGTKGMIDYATKIGLKSVVVYYNVEVSDDKTD